MADSDQFLETTGETAGDIPLAEGVDWTRLAQAMVASVATAWFVGLSALQQAGARMLADPLDAAGGFASSLLESLLTGPSQILARGSSESAAAANGLWPLASFVFGVAIVLAGLWVASRGLEVIRDG